MGWGFFRFSDHKNKHYSTPGFHARQARRAEVRNASLQYNNDNKMSEYDRISTSEDARRGSSIEPTHQEKFEHNFENPVHVGSFESAPEPGTKWGGKRRQETSLGRSCMDSSNSDLALGAARRAFRTSYAPMVRTSDNIRPYRAPEYLCPDCGSDTSSQ